MTSINLKNSFLAIMGLLVASAVMRFIIFERDFGWSIALLILCLLVLIPKGLLHFILIIPPGILFYLNNYAGIGDSLVNIAITVVLMMSIMKSNADSVIDLREIKIFLLLPALYFAGALVNGSIGSEKVYETIMLLMQYSLVFLLVVYTGRRLISPSLYAGNLQLAVLISVIITIFIGLFQTIPIIWGHELPELPGLMYHRNHYGYFACFALAIILPRLLGHGRNKLIWFMLSLVSMLAILLSLCRGAWLASGIMLVISFTIYKKSIFWLAPTIAIPFFLKEPVLMQRLNQDDISSGRFDLWAKLMDMLGMNVLTGNGVGFMWKLTEFDVTEYGGFTSDQNKFIYAHNDFFFLVNEIGIIGPLLLFVFYYLIVQKMMKNLQSSATNSYKTIIMTSLLCTVPVLTAQIFDTAFFGSKLPLKYFALLATSYLCYNSINEKKYQPVRLRI